MKRIQNSIKIYKLKQELLKKNFIHSFSSTLHNDNDHNNRNNIIDCRMS